jgi:hypothetical protein
VVRYYAPAVHRWLGRIYVAAAAFAGIGGLIFIFFTGTVGGLVMDIGFGLYGALMMLCALQTYRYARRRKLDIHRIWAIRLFALAIGSWLYRMEYGFWFIVAGELWHTNTFHGFFDFLMSFFFYIPNLLIAEAYLRGGSKHAGNAAKYITATVMAVSVGLLTIATYFFAAKYWLPAIVT